MRIIAKDVMDVILSEAKNLHVPNRFELLQVLRCAQHDIALPAFITKFRNAII